MQSCLNLGHLGLQVPSYLHLPAPWRSQPSLRVLHHGALQALIQAMGGPLLSHSIHVPSIDMCEDEYLVPDTGGPTGRGAAADAVVELAGI